MDKKYGVYICTGCEIGDSLEISALEKVATSEYKMPICKTHSALCSKEGVEVIKKDIEGEGVNTIIIAACSPRVKTEVFNFGNDKIVERINLREHVVWCHKPNDEDTQMLAEDYMRMGIVKAQKSDLPEPQLENLDNSILVVGGGVAGMTAALEAALAGYKVNLVEKDKLGGWKAKLYKQYPKNPPYKELEDTGIEDLIKKVKENENITVHEGTTIEKISGAPCKFDVTLKNGTQFRAGAIIQATGWKPYDASKLAHLGYGSSPDVVTSVQLEEMARNGKIVRPSDGKVPTSVAFIQCAGSRDPQHLPYCSSVCCMTSLKQASYLRKQDPNIKVYILYKDMRTPGLYEDFYRQIQNDEGVFLTKAEVKGVKTNGGGLIVEADNTLIGAKSGYGGISCWYGAEFR
jgi:quinone-modifying oxidoreductase subunit QmoB